MYEDRTKRREWRRLSDTSLSGQQLKDYYITQEMGRYYILCAVTWYPATANSRGSLHAVPIRCQDDGEISLKDFEKDRNYRHA